MATAVTIPGANGTLVTNTYALPDNTTVALQLQAALVTLQNLGNLVSSVEGQTLNPVSGGQVGALDFSPSSSGGTFAAPAGYIVAADSTGGGSLTLTGFADLFGGDGNINFTNASGLINGLITAGNGNDLFNLVAGSNYSVAAGTGADTYVSGGSGTISGGTGSNLFFVTSTSGGTFINSTGTSDTVVGQGGAATVVSSGSNPLVLSGGSDMEAVLGGSGTSTFVGGSGADTVFGGASNLVFGGDTGVYFVSGTGSSSTVFGGAGQSTLWGGSAVSAGNSVINFGNAGSGSAVLLGGGGNETLSSALSNSDNVFFAGEISVGGAPNDLMVGGIGNDVMFAGTGADTMTGNSGTNVFAFLNGQAGGNDVVTDFNPNDILWLQGYDSTSVGDSFANATVSGGSMTVALSDNTTITFNGISSQDQINNGSNIHLA